MDAPKETAGRVTGADALETLRAQGQVSLTPSTAKVAVGMATCGLASGGDKVYERFEKALADSDAEIALAKTGCIGFCQVEPLVSVTLPGRGTVLLSSVKPTQVPAIVDALSAGELPDKGVLCSVPVDGNGAVEGVPVYTDLGFFGKQVRFATRNCGFIDPESLPEAVAGGGYAALHKALTTMTPAEVIATVKESGLRGRGGAGFPPGVKWGITAAQQSDEKFLVCNADEGDPGAYMDRSILEGDPHAVVEGMLIGAYAMGATQGLIYIRDEYPEAIRKFEKAMADATAAGLLGRDVFGTGLDFSIRVVRGGGAFVCGEETALIASLEGLPGEPRQRPPFPAVAGYWNLPTNINNVETWANVPAIMAGGPEGFSKYGTETSKGTKVFSLVGNVVNTGLIEVPMGLTLREIVFEIGGGVPDGKRFKAIQTGGPSGGCLPEDKLDLPVDYEQLGSAGTIMGSGGMIAMDEDTCMVDVARYFLDFLQEESCGKCTPCREGIGHMLSILEGICAGRGTEEDVELLAQTAQAVNDFSLCGLGQTAPNPVLSTLRYFRDEYDAHIRDHKCPGGVCKDLISYSIVADACTGCTACLKACPSDAITGARDEVHVIDMEKCIKCGACDEVCPDDAVRRE